MGLFWLAHHLWGNLQRTVWSWSSCWLDGTLRGPERRQRSSIWSARPLVFNLTFRYLLMWCWRLATLKRGEMSSSPWLGAIENGRLEKNAGASWASQIVSYMEGLALCFWNFFQNTLVVAVQNWMKNLCTHWLPWLINLKLAKLDCFAQVASKNGSYILMPLMNLRRWRVA